jgi:hypothetical protein
MREAGLSETTGSVTGIPMDIWTFGAPTRGTGNALLVLEWEARGVDDPRDRYVAWHPIVSERISKITEARQDVIRDEKSWDRLLASAGIRLPQFPDFPDMPEVRDPAGMGNMGGIAVRIPPLVDFERDTVVAIFAGEKRSTGYRVRIVNVMKQDDGSLLVTWTVGEPSEYELVIEVPTRPFTIAAIAATDARIEFEYTDAPVDPIYPGLDDWFLPNGDVDVPMMNGMMGR